MKDIAGNDLKIGDKVVTTVRHYRNLVVAEIVGFTKENVKVKTNSRHMTCSEWEKGYTLKHPAYVCLIITQAALEKAVEEARELNAM